MQRFLKGEDYIFKNNIEAGLQRQGSNLRINFFFQVANNTRI